MTSAADEHGAGDGISGVPFCVIDGRYGVSGAQPEETFAQALRNAWGSSSA
jgi:predicted DsbA family dithiol-disulfide isomerase